MNGASAYGDVNGNLFDSDGYGGGAQNADHHGADNTYKNAVMTVMVMVMGGHIAMAMATIQMRTELAKTMTVAVDLVLTALMEQ